MNSAGGVHGVTQFPVDQSCRKTPLLRPCLPESNLLDIGWRRLLEYVYHVFRNRGFKQNNFLDTGSDADTVTDLMIMVAGNDR